MSPFTGKDVPDDSRFESDEQEKRSTVDDIKDRLVARDMREYNGETAAESIRAERDAPPEHRDAG